jgi:DNA-binding transcriptional LysR family regulator
MNLRNIDLNLLAAFDALLRERSVSRAAERMFMTQPAMSHSLSRLRQLLNDPILVRSGSDMKPTVRALALVDPIRRILHEVETVLGPKAPFIPATAHDNFVIACSDYTECILLGPLISRMAHSAPGVRLHARPSDHAQLLNDLEIGEVDIAIGTTNGMTMLEQLRVERLFDDYAVCLLGPRHPYSATTMSLAQFVQMRHLLVSPWGKHHGLVDDWLQHLGLQRQIAHIVTHFASAPFIVAQTDLVLTSPKRLAEQFVQLKQFAELRIVRTAPEFPKYVVHMLWHPAQDNDSTAIWLRQQIRDVCESLA